VRAAAPRLVGSHALVGSCVALRTGRYEDIESLQAILVEPSVANWWDEISTSELEASLVGESPTVLLVIEIDGDLAGGIQYCEETDPQYRHASIDIYLSSRYQGQNHGTAALQLLVRHLIRERGHHRLTIDPSASNLRAIHCYEKAGFQRVGIMRKFERGSDGQFHDGLLMDLLSDDLPVDYLPNEARISDKTSGPQEGRSTGSKREK